IRLETADGTFSLEGVGFLWLQTNSTLFISNQVHSTAHPELLQTSAAPQSRVLTATNGIEIFSDHFDYSLDSGLGAYRDHVRVTGTNLSMTAGTLALWVPVRERKLQSLTAEENVVLNYQGIQLTGDKAAYTPQTGLARVTGSPGWRAGDREGG